MVDNQTSFAPHKPSSICQVIYSKYQFSHKDSQGCSEAQLRPLELLITKKIKILLPCKLLKINMTQLCKVMVKEISKVLIFPLRTTTCFGFFKFLSSITFSKDNLVFPCFTDAQSTYFTYRESSALQCPSHSTPLVVLNIATQCFSRSIYFINIPYAMLVSLHK